MDFKKCTRCGSFYITDNNVCSNCIPKDNADIYKLKSFLEEDSEFENINSLSVTTGISVQNLDRYAKLPELNTYFNKPSELKVDIENFNINLD